MGGVICLCQRYDEGARRESSAFHLLASGGNTLTLALLLPTSRPPHHFTCTIYDPRGPLQSLPSVRTSENLAAVTMRLALSLSLGEGLHAEHQRWIKDRRDKEKSLSDATVQEVKGTENCQGKLLKIA